MSGRCASVASIAPRRVDGLGDDLEAAVLERETNAETRGRVIVGEHDAKALGYGSFASTTVPAPGLEAMLRLPPSISARSCMLVRPSPRPTPTPAPIVACTSNPAPSSVIAQTEPVGAVGQAHEHPLGLAVADRVDRRLVHDPQQCVAPLGVEDHLGLQVEIDLDPEPQPERLHRAGDQHVQRRLLAGGEDGDRRARIVQRSLGGRLQMNHRGGVVAAGAPQSL